MAELRFTVRGGVEAEKFLADLARGAQTFAGTSAFVGTPLPRGLFTDVGTRRGVRATHWLSGLASQAGSMARDALRRRLETPLQMAEALTEVGEKVKGQAAGRAPRGETGKLRGSVTVLMRRGMPGGRLNRR